MKWLKKKREKKEENITMKKREFIESGRHGTYAYEFEGFNQSGVMYEYPAETP